MKNIKIFYTPTFSKNFNKLSSNIKEKAYEKEEVFRDNIFNSSLKTHKLSGNFSNYWSFSINYHYRIIFRFLKEKEVLFVDVGTHQLYR